MTFDNERIAVGSPSQSFVCRHRQKVSLLGFLVFVVPIVVIAVTAGNQPIGYVINIREVWVMAIGITLLYSASRPYSQNWATAWGKVLLGWGVIIFIVPWILYFMLVIMDGIGHWLT